MNIDIKDINQAFLEKDYKKTLSLCKNLELKNADSDEKLNAIIQNIKGICLLNLNQIKESEQAFLKSVKKFGPNIETLFNLCHVYLKKKDLKKCIFQIEQILKLNPYFLKVYYFIFNLKFQDIDTNEAEGLLLKVTTLDVKKFQKRELIQFINYLAKNNELEVSKFLCEKLLFTNDDLVYFLYGLILKKSNQPMLAIDYFKKAIRLKNTNAYYFIELATAYEIIGDFENTKFYLLEGLKLDPFLGSAYKLLSDIKCLDSSDVNNLEKKIKISSNENFLMHAYYALSNYYFDNKNHEKAHENFTNANKLRSNSIFFDENKFKKISEFYQKPIKDLIDDVKISIIKKNAEPIFLVGLPRSGSTLIEQILSSHSEVKGFGEVDILQNILNNNIYKSFTNTPILKQSINENSIKKIRSEYYSRFTKLEKNKYFVDKMLFNFFYIGVILKAFPFAKIIFCKRDLRDIFVSIIRNYFGSSGFSFAYKEQNIYHFMEIFSKHMNYWLKKEHDHIFIMDYGNLVNHKEVAAKKLFNFLNLDFEENCLNFYKQDKQIYTASSFQVRSPIHKQSFNLWSNYEKFYKSTFEKLDKLNI